MPMPRARLQASLGTVMGAWTAQAAIGAAPDEVLDALTNPEAIMDWSPVEFEVDGLDGSRLATGSRAVVAGRIAGWTLAFDVDVEEATDGRLALTATSHALALEVEYVIEALEDWSQVTGSVAVQGHGFRGRVVAKAVEGLLAGGSLDLALGRISRQVENGTTTAPLAAAA